MTALATLTDLAALVGPISPEDTDRAVALLGHASTLIRAETGQLFDTPPVPDLVVTITAKVASRAWNVPDGVSMEMAGPFQVQFQQPGLYLRDDEKAMLGQHKTSGRSGLVSVRTRLTPEILEEIDDDWLFERESDWL